MHKPISPCDPRHGFYAINNTADSLYCHCLISSHQYEARGSALWASTSRMMKSKAPSLGQLVRTVENAAWERNLHFPSHWAHGDHLTPEVLLMLLKLRNSNLCIYYKNVLVLYTSKPTCTQEFINWKLLVYQ